MVFTTPGATRSTPTDRVVAIEGEDQRDVDADAFGQAGGDRRQSLPGGGNLDAPLPRPRTTSLWWTTSGMRSRREPLSRSATRPGTTSTLPATASPPGEW